MVQRDRWFAGRDRRWFDYDYEVPGQWQGRFETIRLIGDKKGSHTTRFLAGNPGLLDGLRKRLACPLRFVHVVRNPFDNISTMFRRQKVSYPLETSIQRYLEQSEANAALLERIGAENVHVVRLEELIASPKETLAGLCAFFGLDAPADYLEACAGVVFPAPRQTRAAVDWSPELVRTTQAQASTASPPWPATASTPGVGHGQAIAPALLLDVNDDRVHLCGGHLAREGGHPAPAVLDHPFQVGARPAFGRGQRDAAAAALSLFAMAAPAALLEDPPAEAVAATARPGPPGPRRPPGPPARPVLPGAPPGPAAPGPAPGIGGGSAGLEQPAATTRQATAPARTTRRGCG